MNSMLFIYFKQDTRGIPSVGLYNYLLDSWAVVLSPSLKLSDPEAHRFDELP